MAEETEVMVGAYKSYIVKEGDTLLKISRNYYQDAAHVEEIRQLNQIEDPDYIYPEWYCVCRRFVQNLRENGHTGKKVDAGSFFNYTGCIIA